MHPYCFHVSILCISKRAGLLQTHKACSAGRRKGIRVTPDTIPCLTSLLSPPKTKRLNGVMLEFLLQAALGRTKTFPLLATLQTLDLATRLHSASPGSSPPLNQGCTTAVPACTAGSAQALEPTIATTPADVACKHAQTSLPLLVQPERSQPAAVGSVQLPGVLPRTAGVPADRGEGSFMHSVVSPPAATLPPVPALDLPSALPSVHPVPRLSSTDRIMLTPNLSANAYQSMPLQPSSGSLPDVSMSTQVQAQSLPLPISPSDSGARPPALSTLQSSVQDPESVARLRVTVNEVLAKAPPLDRLYGEHDATSHLHGPGLLPTGMDLWQGTQQHDSFPMPDMSATSAEVTATTEQQSGLTGSAARAMELPVAWYSSKRPPATEPSLPSNQQPFPKRRAIDSFARATWGSMFEQLSQFVDHAGRVPHTGPLGDWASQQLKEARCFFKSLRMPLPASPPSALTNDQYLKLTAIPAFLSELSRIEQRQCAQMTQLVDNGETSCAEEAGRPSVPVDEILAGLEQVCGVPMLAEGEASPAEQSQACIGACSRRH